MTASTVTLAPGVTHLVAPGTGACVELEHAFTLSRTLDSTMGAGSRGTAVRTAIERAALGDTDSWLSHVRAAAGCSSPVRLSGVVEHQDRATGAVLLQDGNGGHA